MKLEIEVMNPILLEAVENTLRDVLIFLYYLMTKICLLRVCGCAFSMSSNYQPTSNLFTFRVYIIGVLDGWGLCVGHFVHDLWDLCDPLTSICSVYSMQKPSQIVLLKKMVVSYQKIRKRSWRKKVSWIHIFILNQLCILSYCSANPIFSAFNLVLSIIFGSVYLFS